MNGISKEDVINVATGINVVLTNDDVELILTQYGAYDDPTATWDLIVEDLIYSLILKK